MDKELRKQRANERRRERYRTDPEYRQKVIHQTRNTKRVSSKEQRRIWQKRWEDKYPEKQAAYREKQIASHKIRYQTDPEYRKKQIEYSCQYAKEHRTEITARRKKSPKYQGWVKAYTESYKEKQFDKSLRNRFGISAEEYLRLLTKQGGKCAICGNGENEKDKWTGGVKRLAVDHDHVTLKVRGLLCAKCNKGLGSFRENPDTLLKAAEYLKANQYNEVYGRSPVADALEGLRAFQAWQKDVLRVK